MKRLLIVLSFLFLAILSPAQQGYVLICKSPTAYVYHSHYCKGLNNCTHSVKKNTLNEAVSMGRRACKMCYK